jgi:Ca2+-binding EF-hand superfamily protein
MCGRHALAGSGTIDVKELRTALAALGQNPTDEELFVMISQVSLKLLALRSTKEQQDNGEFLLINEPQANNSHRIQKLLLPLQIVFLHI